MTRRKDSYEITQWAKKRGWTPAGANGMGHLVFTRRGTEVVVGSKLPGRAMRNAQLTLERAERRQAQQPEDPYMASKTATDPKNETVAVEHVDGDDKIPALQRGDVWVTVQTVTPDMAAEWLEHNDKNPRRLRIPVAQRYAADIAAGAWAFPTSFIGFSPNGDINNGQHTLWGVVEGGKPITTLVIYNVPEDAVAAMDRGLKRSLADTLHGQGIPKPRDLQSTIRLCWKWENGRLLNNRRVPTDVECLTWLEANPGAIDATVATHPVQRKAKLKKSVIAPVFYRAMMIDPDAAGSWLDELVTGIGLEEGSPTLRLREYAVSNRVRKDSQIYDLAVAVKSWNAHVTGGRIYTLRWTREGANRESFPAMVNVDGKPVAFDGRVMTDTEYQDYEEANSAG